MLITKEVEVVLCNRNIKWFEDKGYEIPRIKKLVMIKMVTIRGQGLLFQKEQL